MTAGIHSRGLLRIAIALLSAGLAALCLTLLDSAWAASFFVTLVIVVTMALMIVLRADKTVPLICDPLVLYCAMFSQFYIVAPVGIILFGPTMQRGLAQSSVLAALIAFEIHLVMFLLAYQSRLGVIAAENIPDFAARSRRKLPTRLGLVILTTACLLGWVAYFEYQGGLLSRLLRGYGTSKPSGFFGIPIIALLAVTFLIQWWFLQERPMSRRRMLMFGGILLLELFFYGVVLGVRKRLFFLFFGVVAIYLLTRGVQKIPKGRLVAAMVALLLFSSYWATVRSRPLLDIVAGRDDPRILNRSLREGYLSTVAGPFEVACLVTDIFPEVEPYRYGKTILVAVLGFIPRSVWPDKPVGIGKELTRYTNVRMRYDPTGGHSVTPTLIGDFYANLGLLGVAIGGLLMGFVSRTVLAYMKKGMVGGLQSNCARVVLPAIFLSGLVEVRASMAMMLTHYAPTVPPVLIMLVFCRTDPVPAPESPAVRTDHPTRPPAGLPHGIAPTRS